MVRIPETVPERLKYVVERREAPPALLLAAQDAPHVAGLLVAQRIVHGLVDVAIRDNCLLIAGASPRSGWDADAPQTCGELQYLRATRASIDMNRRLHHSQWRR